MFTTKVIIRIRPEILSRYKPDGNSYESQYINCVKKTIGAIITDVLRPYGYYAKVDPDISVQAQEADADCTDDQIVHVVVEICDDAIKEIAASFRTAMTHSVTTRVNNATGSLFASLNTPWLDMKPAYAFTASMHTPAPANA